MGLFEVRKPKGFKYRSVFRQKREMNFHRQQPRPQSKGLLLLVLLVLLLLLWMYL